MINENRNRVARNSFVYAIAYVAGHAYVFVTLPILTINLSGDEFGLYIILVQIVTFMQMLSVALFGQALLRQHIDYEGEEKKRFVGTMLLAAVLFSLVVAFMAYNWQLFIFANLYPNISSSIDSYFFFACLWSIAVSIRSVAMTFLKALEKPKVILFQSLLYGILLIIVLLIFVGYLQQGLLGAMKSLLIAETIAQIALAFHLHQYITIKPHIQYLRKAITFSWPLLPGSLAMLIYTNLDRIILSQFVSLNEVGLYGFGLMIGNIAALAVSAYISSYSPRLISFSNSNSPKAVSKLASQLMIDNIRFLGPVVGVLFIISSMLVALLQGTNEFDNATIVVCGIATGHLVRSLYLFFSNGLFLYARSIAILCLSLMLLAIGAIIMYLLAKYTGIYGMAFASILTYLIMIPFSRMVLIKWLKIKLPIKEILVTSLVICGLFICELIILNYNFRISHYEYWILKLIECAIIWVVWGLNIYNIFRQYAAKKTW